VADPATPLVVRPVERDEWRRLAEGFADHGYQQVWEYGQLAAARVGAVSEHVVVVRGDEVCALADVRVRRVPLLGGIAYVSAGPLTRRAGAPGSARLAAAAAALREEYVARRGLVLRLLAPVGPAAWNEASASAIAGAGFRPTSAGRRYRTILLEVARPDDAIRAGLHAKWRNHLRRAEKAGLTVTASAHADGFERFLAMFETFVARKGFDVTAPLEVFVGVQREAPEADRFVVFAAERDGRAIAAHVASFRGDTGVFVLGATLPEALECDAAYLLAWRATLAARAAGCAWYDLGGIDPGANPGVHHFKERTGGTDVAAAGPFEASSGLRASLLLAAERLRARHGR
jgi:hypothetical protein